MGYSGQLSGSDAARYHFASHQSRLLLLLPTRRRTDLPPVDVPPRSPSRLVFIHRLISTAHHIQQQQQHKQRRLLL